uniref:Putative secreted peptide n=1 Tax=Anopheles braziliensis TaxID=58242 RepID=A0A2M3ZT88_9DIPT
MDHGGLTATTLLLLLLLRPRGRLFTAPRIAGHTSICQCHGATVHVTCQHLRYVQGRQFHLLVGVAGLQWTRLRRTQ